MPHQSEKWVEQHHLSSEILGAEELEIYGYVGKETAKFKNGASARDIAVAVNSWKVKPELWHRLHTQD